MSKTHSTKRRGKVLLLLGVLLASAVTLIVIEWRTFTEGYTDLGVLEITDYDHEIIPVVVITPPERVMPPDQSSNYVIGEPPPDTFSVKTPPKFGKGDSISEDSLDWTEPPEKVEPPPVLVKVEKRPTFKQCKSLPTEAERNQCTDELIYTHLNSVKRYPAEMKKQKITGDVFVTFIVDAQGKTKIVSARSRIKGGKQLEDEAKRMVQSFPRFTPATQQGKTVQFKRTIPISFILR